MLILKVITEVRNHCHITGKFRCSAYKDCNINVKFIHKIPVLFHNLKNYDTRLIMLELGKFNFKINVTLNGLKKYMSVKIKNKLIFNKLSFPLNSLVKNLGAKDFKYLS